ncbi:MAG: thrombospondin type 3 repeat-containing protein [Candidatus Magasanikbacteria bacterium]
MANQEKLTIQQKVGAGLLAILGVLAISLGGLQLRNTIYSPFVIEPQAQAEKALAQFFKNDKTRLQRIDTDNDDLSDYAEINFHKTSRYLKDTDSDGLTDKEEVEQGTDPLCPQDENCDQNAVPNSPTTTGGPYFTFGNIKKRAKQKLQQGEGLKTPKERIQEMIKNPDQLRQMLLETGRISKERLKQIDDETLKQTARKMLNRGQVSLSTQSSQDSTTTPGSGTTGNKLELIEKLIDQPDKLRDLLAKSGEISRERLEQIDDETLKQTARKILKQKRNN